MGGWKKGFRGIPPVIRTNLQCIEDENVKALAGKIVSVEDVASGLYAHLGLTSKELFVGNSWELIPASKVGKTSLRNSDGWMTVRKDLPKYKKYFYHDIENFGNAARNGWSTVAIPREVYERDSFPPYLFHVEVRIQEARHDGKFGIVFAIDETFSKASASFDADFLFALNLLQENTGVSGVVEAKNPDFVFSSQLQWDVFPPGQVSDLAARIHLGGGRNAPDLAVIIERLKLFEQFQPVEYLRGLGGNDHYIGAKYANNLVVFENMRHGNALYVLYDDWEVLSGKPRSEILRLPQSKFDRIIHNAGWQNIFAVLLQKELQERGVRIRIGRNARRRRR